MNIHNKGTLIEFWLKHGDSKKELLLWYNDVMSKSWTKPNDVKKDYISASIIKNNRVVFNIKRNDYRLIVEFNYFKGWGFIKFIGTHAEYDRINAETVNKFPGKRKNNKI